MLHGAGRAWHRLQLQAKRGSICAHYLTAPIHFQRRQFRKPVVHAGDFRAGDKGINYPLPVVRAQALLLVGKVPAETVPAVDRALSGYHEQGTAAVLADEPGGGDGAGFGAGGQGIGGDSGAL